MNGRGKYYFFTQQRKLFKALGARLWLGAGVNGARKRPGLGRYRGIPDYNTGQESVGKGHRKPLPMFGGILAPPAGGPGLSFTGEGPSGAIIRRVMTSATGPKRGVVGVGVQDTDAGVNAAGIDTYMLDGGQYVVASAGRAIGNWDTSVAIKYYVFSLRTWARGDPLFLVVTEARQAKVFLAQKRAPCCWKKSSPPAVATCSCSPALRRGRGPKIQQSIKKSPLQGPCHLAEPWQSQKHLN